MGNPAQLAAALGQGGDSEVGHLTPGEIVVPLPVQKAHPELVQALAKALQDMGMNPGQYSVGGDDDQVNPETGMPQYDAEDSAGNNMSDNNNVGGGGPDNGNYGGSDGSGDWQTGAGFAGTEMGPAHAQDVNAAFAGDKGAMGRQGWGPNDSGFGAFGVTGATNYNPMTNQNVYGAGFNLGRGAGSLVGNMIGGPVGGMLGGYLGGKLTDTTFGFGDPSGLGYGQQTAGAPAQQGGSNNLLDMATPQGPGRR